MACPRPSGMARPKELRAAIAGSLVFVSLAVAALWWAKWSPSSHKLGHLLVTRTWTEGDPLAAAGKAGSAPSLAGATAFTASYLRAVWPAIVAGLVISAGLQSLVPRDWLCRALGRSTTWGRGVAGGVLALPSMMCTCCSAPVMVALRRQGIPVSAVLAYWLGNPLLNPAVLAFLALVAPWQWVAVRLTMGATLVFVAAPALAHLMTREQAPPDAEGAATVPDRSTPDDRANAAGRLASGPPPIRFAAAFARLGATLVPEYLLVVFLVGLFRGWLFPLGGGGVHATVLAVLAAATLGTLVVLPTAGEIPVLQGLSAAGGGPAVIGTLLVTLPAVSLPSMAMASRALPGKLLAALAATVMLGGVLGGLLLLVLSS